MIKRRTYHFYFLLLFVSFTLFSCSMNQQVTDSINWRLVYENDQDGITVQGDIQELIRGIKKGKEVRIMITTDSLSYITEAQHIWIKNNVVYIQNSSHISTVFRDDQLVIQDDAYHWYFTVSTKGDRYMSRWLVGEHTLKAANHDKVGVSWFFR